MRGRRTHLSARNISRIQYIRQTCRTACWCCGAGVGGWRSDDAWFVPFCALGGRGVLTHCVRGVEVGDGWSGGGEGEGGEVEVGEGGK